MTLRNAVKTIFGKIKNYVASAWREIGGYVATFTAFGRDVYASEVVRSCIRTLAEHTSKANVKVMRNKIPGDLKLQRMIQYRPNPFMNGKDFLYKVRTLLECYNTVFIYINRDDTGACTGLYPMPHCTEEAVEVDGKLYIRFYLPTGEQVVASWEDLAVLRKDFRTSDIWGDDNTAIIGSLDLLNTTAEGMANAIKSTANLRGIVKSTKAALKPEDVTKMRDDFVASYMQISNSSGVAALDASMEYTPITLAPVIANYKSVEELRNNIYRYWGMCEEIVMGKATPDQRESFYEGKIETFLLALSLELTNKVFTDRQRVALNEIIFESNRMSYMSMQEKLSLVSMVDRGAMTPNEWRQALNLAPLPGGDVPIRRLDTAPTNGTTGSQAGSTTLDNSVDANGIVDDAEKVAGKTLNGAQTQSLITVVTQYQAGTLTLGQAINIISVSIGVTKQEAQELIEGNTEGGNASVGKGKQGVSGDEPTPTN